MDYLQLMRDSFDAAVRAADPAVVIAAHLPPPDGRRTWVVGAGKAAASMAQALESAWTGPEPLQGLVVTRHGHRAPTRHIQVIEAWTPAPRCRRRRRRGRHSAHGARSEDGRTG